MQEVAPRSDPVVYGDYHRKENRDYLRNEEHRSTVPANDLLVGAGGGGCSRWTTLLKSEKLVGMVRPFAHWPNASGTHPRPFSRCWRIHSPSPTRSPSRDPPPSSMRYEASLTRSSRRI